MTRRRVPPPPTSGLELDEPPYQGQANADTRSVWLTLGTLSERPEDRIADVLGHPGPLVVHH
jgi:hypothetical protein